MDAPALYPLTFAPVLKEKIWGGDKIRTVLGREYPGLSNCGEAWVLSGLPDNASPVSAGPLAGRSLPELIGRYGAQLIGNTIRAKYGETFPLLVKFISTADDLSIQVHPDDAMARRETGGAGKTEMWYVLEADPGATLSSGFVRPLSRDEYLSYFHSGRLEELLQRVEVAPGDCFYLPAGRVHAIGRGILLAEIQQSSDITYRIYDYDRRDAAGQKRELHVEKALEAMDFTASGDPKTHYRPPESDGEAALVDGPYFSTVLVRLSASPIRRKLPAPDVFTVYTCVSGKARIASPQGTAFLKAGECVLLPACIPWADLDSAHAGETLLLETRPK